MRGWSKLLFRNAQQEQRGACFSAPPIRELGHEGVLASSLSRYAWHSAPTRPLLAVSP
jgi:hypothetical protein